MPTAVIAGKTYQTTIIDGKEWLAENFAYKSPALGRFWNDASEPDYAGGYYTYSEFSSITSLLVNGWRIPDWDDLYYLYTYAVGQSGGANGPSCVEWFEHGPLAVKPCGYRTLRRVDMHNVLEWSNRDGQSPRTVMRGYASYMGEADAVSEIMLEWIYADGNYVSNTDGFTPSGEGAFSLRLVRTAPLFPSAETPVITPATGHGAGPVTAKVSCTTAGASIHYTTDGSTPTESSPVLHDGGIVLGSWTSPAVTLKVMASASGHNSSGISTATYQFTAQAPMVSLQMKPESGYFFSEAESRKPRVLGASGKGIFAGTIQWELLDSEWPMFLDWWEDKHKGVNPCNIYCCTGAEPLLHTFQAVGPYEVVRDTGVRKVTLPVKITMRPTGLYSGWGSFLGGPPVAYPVIVPMPQWGFQRAEAAVFLSTTGAPTAARPVATRGELLSLEWKALTGMQFDVLVDWWSTYLGQGRRKFTISLPGETGPLLCQLVEDPAFTVEGVHFRGSMKVFAAPVRTLAPPPA